MWRGLRRLIWIAVLGGTACAAVVCWRRRRSSADEPTWPPVVPRDDAATTTTTTGPATPRPFVAAEPAPEPAPAAQPAIADASDAPPARWREPIDGTCPAGYQVKANVNSGIFHVPGGRFYDRTVPERCYASADDAAADGFRAAKA